MTQLDAANIIINQGAWAAIEGIFLLSLIPIWALASVYLEIRNNPKEWKKLISMEIMLILIALTWVPILLSTL